MKTTYFKIIIFTICLACSGVSSFAQTPLKNQESWKGTLNVSGMSLRIVFNVGLDEQGKLVGTLDSPDQNAFGIPLSEVNATEDSLIIKANNIGMLYKGKKIRTETIEGKFSQGGQVFDLNLAKTTEKVEGSKRPQTPQKPFPYREEEVVYENKAAQLKIAGTLTLPKEGEKFPALLLITGSGQQDRDETLLGHKPFWVIADYLTRQGIAVLRVDDRGIGKSTGDFQNATSKDFASDVLAGVEYLKSRKDIQSIGLAGHSEGGLIAPMLAVQSKDVNFIILLAVPGEKGSKIMLDQADLILKANGMEDDFLDKIRTVRTKVFEIIDNEPDNDKALEKIMAEATKMESIFSEKEQEILKSMSQGKEDEQFKMLLSPWFRHFLKYDPKENLTKVKCPVLALNGAKDLQVPAKSNLEAIQKHLKTAGNKQYVVKELPDLNHLFQHSTTGSPNEYAMIEETFSPEVLKMMADWILGLKK
jgi:uncharacterized protein